MAWAGKLEAALLGGMDSTRDYISANMATLVPIMVLNGIRPVNKDDEEVSDVWRACTEHLFSRLINLRKALSMQPMIRHFARALLTGSTLASIRESISEAKRFEDC